MDLSLTSDLVSLFFQSADARPDEPFLLYRSGISWHNITWGEVARSVLRLSRGLKGLGLREGDRVALVSDNRPEWLIADLALLSAGCVTVPAYVSNTVSDHRHILENSGARAAIVGGSVVADRMRAAMETRGTGEFLISMDPPPRPEGIRGEEKDRGKDRGVAAAGRPSVHFWDDLTRGAGPTLADWRKEVARPGRDSLACIIHTSGTDGVPRGVMLTHGNILAQLEGAHELLQRLTLQDDVFVSFLPLSHAYEHTHGQFLPVSLGARICYADSPQAIAAALSAARPTIMLVVPRFLETLRRQILQGLRRESRTRRALFAAALALGRRRGRRGSLPLLLRPLDLLVERTVRRRIRERFGGRMKALVSGGAPLSPEVGGFFSALGVPLLQGYGLTEAAPVVCCNPPGAARLETVGPPLRGVEVRLNGEGEVLVRGPSVMKGYWREPEATAAALHDGWLRTGDVGTFDSDGYLVIRDRKKDIIKNSGGEMISPQKVEGRLLLEPEILQAMVFGDRLAHLSAVLVPDESFLQGRPGESALTPLLIRSLLSEAVERANADLQPKERVRSFLIAGEPFTTGNGQLTPTFKVRRREILNRYRAEIQALATRESGGPEP